MALWAQALLTGKLLKPETISQAWTPASLNDGEQAGYGLGWGIGRLEGHREVNHGGGHATGFTSFLGLYPEDRLGVVVLLNRGGANPGRIARRVAGLYVPELAPQPEQTARGRPTGNDRVPGDCLTKAADSWLEESRSTAEMWQVLEAQKTDIQTQLQTLGALQSLELLASVQVRRVSNVPIPRGFRQRHVDHLRDAGPKAQGRGFDQPRGGLIRTSGECGHAWSGIHTNTDLEELGPGRTGPQHSGDAGGARKNTQLGHGRTPHHRTPKSISGLNSTGHPSSILFQNHEMLHKLCVIDPARRDVRVRRRDGRGLPAGPRFPAARGRAQGEVIGPLTLPSQVFTNTTRHYWIYVPAQYDSRKPAALMVFQDGHAFCQPDGGLSHSECVR